MNTPAGTVASEGMCSPGVQTEDLLPHMRL